MESQVVASRGQVLFSLWSSSLKMEYDKLVGEKAEIQRHSIMVRRQGVCAHMCVCMCTCVCVSVHLKHAKISHTHSS